MELHGALTPTKFNRFYQILSTLSWGSREIYNNQNQDWKRLYRKLMWYQIVSKEVHFTLRALRPSGVASRDTRKMIEFSGRINQWFKTTAMKTHNLRSNEPRIGEEMFPEPGTESWPRLTTLAIVAYRPETIDIKDENLADFEDFDPCSICFEKFDVPGDSIVILRCHPSHRLHENCLKEMCLESVAALLCPLCRAPMV